MKILFQGDSITDAGRGREDFHEMGNGYPKYAAELIKKNFPDADLELINLGISGDRTESLVQRWEQDCIKVQPDIVSILIGVNDTWHRADKMNWVDNGYFEGCYRNILERTKRYTNAKIIMMEQFLLYVPDKAYFRVDLDPKIQIVRKLAREYADVFIPLDGILAAASVNEKPTHWAADGVHPTPAGAELIAEHYLKAIAPIIEEINK